MSLIKIQMLQLVMVLITGLSLLSEASVQSYLSFDQTTLNDKTNPRKHKLFNNDKTNSRKLKLINEDLNLIPALVLDLPNPAPAPTLVPDLPNPKLRMQLIEAVNNEMIRLDAEGFYARKQRPLSWPQIVSQIKNEAAQAQSWPDFIRTINRFDAAYTNLHSYAEFGSAIDAQVLKPIIPLVRFGEDWLSPDQVRHRVKFVESGLNWEGNSKPEVGDELIAINDKPISEWEFENFNYCKWALKAQCDFILSSQLERELLSWNRNLPLTYTLKRGETVWTISVPTKTSDWRKRDPARFICKNESNRYSHFKLVYSGNRACIYQNQNQPDTAILRITSFHYQGIPENEIIHSVESEIEALYPWWKTHAHWQHLIIDVINNGGGNAPIPYYQILLQKEFQEQYTSFKKIPELLNDDIRKEITWGTPGQEIWFQNLLKNGIWAQTPFYDYLPPVPMFCPSEDKDCSAEKFQVREHGFHGRVSILLNQNCISSCDGFVFALKEQLGEKVKLYGHPQAADSAYARLTINVYLDSNAPDGVRTQVVPIRHDSNTQALFSQTVSVALSLMGNGQIVTGMPLPLQQFVPQTLSEDDQWPNAVVETALSNN